MEQTLGLYLHIPFCVQKCNYCDFCSAPASKEHRDAYVEALCRHLIATSKKARDHKVDTVYFGGGTPTVLPPSDLSRILDTVRTHYDLAADAEITTECNPVTRCDGLFEGLLSAGVNRLSIGLQSIHEEELRLLGRLHGYKEFCDTFTAARRAGFGNISADVMFGIPAQTPQSFTQTLTALCDLSPEHISAYGLRIEEGTPFHKNRSSLPLPDEDTEAQMAELVSTLLPTRGYARYEISNYARPGKESRHNLRYWLRSPYLGFGPAAHSFFAGERFETLPDTHAYVEAVKGEDFASLAANRQQLSKTEEREEYVMLRMRLARGIDRADFAHRFGTSFEECYGDPSALVRGGFLENNADRIAFTARGMQLSNAILSEWLDFGGIE